MQRTVTPSGQPYIGSNPIPSTNLGMFVDIESIEVKNKKIFENTVWLITI